MKKSIEQLKEEEQNTKLKLTKIQILIERKEENELIPEIKKKYEGKCFRTRNNYSCPECPSDYWWHYYYVEKIINLQEAKMWSFQTDRDGKISVEKEHIYLSMLEIKITKKQFTTAYNKMLKHIEKISKGI